MIPLPHPIFCRLELLTLWASVEIPVVAAKRGVETLEQPLIAMIQSAADAITTDDVMIRWCTAIETPQRPRTGTEV